MTQVLRDILYEVPLESVQGSTAVSVRAIRQDSRAVEPGDLFVAVPGTVADGHRFISVAVERGAVAVVCERLPEAPASGTTWIKVRDSRLALAVMAGNFYDRPSQDLQLVGVTGTNGKTTTATMLYELFTRLGYKTGLLSTVANRIGDQVVEATHTTPDPVSLNALLRDMADAGCSYAFMEVSSHAIHQQRIAGLRFAGGIFTNISRDHLDYHKDFKEYIFVKKAFFDQLPAGAFALVNADDRRGAVMVQNTAARVRTYALKSMADYRMKILENSFGGLVVEVNHMELHSRMIGRFNAYNILAVYAAGELLGVEPAELLQAISVLRGAEGRFDYVVSQKDRIVAVIDYAHTPDALKNVLQTIRDIRTGNEQVITLIGCGGDRDKGKRPMMAGIAAEFSDKVILTSDNPRSESPEAIIADMRKGIEAHLSRKVLVITDRREAIRTACSLAAGGDILLVAGKGHEKYQEVGGKRYPFDDKEQVLEALKEFDR